MSYEYEQSLGLCGGPPFSPDVSIVDQDVVDQQDNGLINPAAAVGVVGLLGGVVLLALFAPFVIGAISAAVVAPKGRKKKAAKWGAVVGGVGSWVVYPFIYGVTGSQGVARSFGAISPVALGLYMGLREKEALERV